MHRLNQHPTGIVCAGCQIAHPNTDCRPLTPEEIAEIEPPHRCVFCGEFLLEAGRVKRDLEALGFEFVVHNNWSAWMRTRPVYGSFGETTLSIAVVDFLVRRDDWHAPLDDEDGPVVLKRSRTWPLIQPGSDEAGAFHWVQEHEAHSASCVTAAIAFLQADA